MPKLIVKVKDRVIKEIVLSKDAFTVGRLPENDLALDDNLTSRRHSKVAKQGNEYLVYDLGSANGTFLNKKGIKTATLKEGDEIQIGETILVYKGESPYGQGVRVDWSSDVIKSINDISEGYRLDAKDMFARGESLAVAAKPLARTKESERFFVLYQLGKAVTSTTSLPEVLDIAMSSIFDFINADRGLIMLLDKESRKLTPQVTRCQVHGSGEAGPTPKAFWDSEPIYVSHTITDKVINDQVSILTTDATHDHRFQRGESIARYNIRSALCVPLWEKQEIFGVIYLDNSLLAHAFTNDDLELLTAIANQIAIRIKQDELYETLKTEALLRSNLERYHSPDVVEMIIHQAKDKEIGLAVEEKEVSILFVDIQDFTTISERISPRAVAEMLNEFLETMTHVVFEYKGSVNKYVGDSILAVFGAPIELTDHPVQAVRAGIKMIKELEKLHEKDATEIPKYHVRIGINTGLVVAGNIGSEKRIEYTVLGDAVNIASRLNQYGSANEVVIGEATYGHVKDLFQTKDLGAVKLKGKKKDVKVYRIVC